MDKDHSLTSSAAHLVTPYLNTSISRGLHTESNVHGSAATQSPSLNMDARSEHLLNAKGISFQDQDSPSTQSTGQSSAEVACSGDDNPSRQISFSAQSDVCRELEETQGKGYANNIKSGISDMHVAPSKANLSFHYADPHLGGLMPAAYLPQATIWNPQMVGQVALPSVLIENEPVFVNAKQFHAIMRRRQQRAKLEAQNKIIKSRKPYLHESRHVHALKRPRGSGGRFLNAKQLQELAEQEHNMSIEQQHANGNISRSVIHQTQNSTSGLDITVASDGIDLFGHSEFQLSDCPSQTTAAMYVHGQSNDMHGGVNTHHFSVRT